MLAGWLLASLLASRPVAVPEVLSTTAVFSKRCAEIVYSSNRENLYRPFSVSIRDGVPATPVEFPLRPPLDFLAGSLSHEGETKLSKSAAFGVGPPGFEPGT